MENYPKTIRNLTNLQQRIISAVILIPALCVVVYIGGALFLVVATFVLALGAWEFNHLYLHNPANRTSTIFMVSMVVAMCLSRYFFGFHWSWRLFSLCFMLSMVYSVSSFERGNDAAAIGFATLVTGVVYLGWLGSYLIALRQLDQGLVWVVFTLFITFSTDIGAYCFGKLFGRRHMFTRVSPKKTWEGYFGGIVFAIGIAYIGHQFVPAVSQLMSCRITLLFATAVAVICPFGDFGESMLKRSFAVKDSSNLIPGHGGILDRLDSILFSMPIAFWFYEIVNSRIAQP